MTEKNHIFYPFLDPDLLEEKYSMSDMFSDEEVHEAAMQRITDATNVFHPPELTLTEFGDTAHALSYPLSRIIISELNNPFLTYLFTVSEARRVINYTQYTEASPLEILEELEYDITEDTIDTAYENYVPPEYSNPEISDVDAVAFWCIAVEIDDGLRKEVPEEVTDKVSELITDANKLIPKDFSLTKRGLVQNHAEDYGLDEFIEVCPLEIREVSQEIHQDQFITQNRSDIPARVALDAGYETEEIAGWYDWSAEATESYGIQHLYDLEGDTKYEDVGLHTPTIRDLEDRHIIESPSLISTLTNHPIVYAVLNISYNLYPATLRD